MFRVTGPTRFHDFAALREALDAALMHRLPDVTILTRGGGGTAILAASYAAARALDVNPLALNVSWFPHSHDAWADRDTRLVAEADAAVVVWGEGGEMTDPSL